jgi:hypothetical protein
MGRDRIHRDAIRSSDHDDLIRSGPRDDGEVISLRITPDSRLDNKQVEELARTLCLYTSPLERWKGKKIQRPSFLSFETVLEKGNTCFYVSVPPHHESLARKAIESTWPKVSVEKVSDPFNQSPNLISTIELDRHYMFALRVDKRKAGALLSVLETLRNLEQNEKVYIQTIGVPAPKDWYISAAEAYERFKKGEFPQKVQLNKKTITRTSLKALTHTVYGAASLMSEVLSGEALEPLRLDEGQRAMILRDGSLSTATMNKTKGDAYEFCMRIGVVSSDNERANAIMRMVSMAFRDLDGDNLLVSTPVNPQRAFKRMKERRMTVLSQKDYLSIPEFSRLCTLPSREQQELYKIPNISQLETDVSSLFFQGGMYFGDITYKGQNQAVYYPVSDYDQLCLPRIYIGGMGSGKTKGALSNILVEAALNGFGALAIDPARGEIYDEVSSFLPPEKIIRIKFGETPLAIDWRETLHSTKSKNRLANTIISFFNTADMEAGGQTQRFLRAAVMLMETGELNELIRIFTDPAYRALALEGVSEESGNMHEITMLEFHNHTEARQRQIVSPILNRLDTILGDEYLSECMQATEGLDMVEILSEKKAVIIDVPKKELGEEVLDIIVNLLMTKINLAMTLREADHPFFVAMDEPHQYLRSANIWKAAAVESRKWRVGFAWSFHSWEQIPNNLAEIVKSAGPHYTIYKSSKKTFKDLAEEIAPFTIEDGINLKRFHSINVLTAGDGSQRAFIAKMALPPSKRKSSR